MPSPIFAIPIYLVLCAIGVAVVEAWGTVCDWALSTNDPNRLQVAVACAHLGVRRPSGLRWPVRFLSFGATDDESLRGGLEAIWDAAWRSQGLPKGDLLPRRRAQRRALEAGVDAMVAAYLSGVAVEDVLGPMAPRRGAA